MSLARQTEIMEAQVDLTGAQTVIDYAHHEVHAGKSFCVYNTQSIETATFKYQIKAPNTTTKIHMIIGAECTGEMTVLVTEGSDKTDGTAVAAVNHNRQGTPAVATCVVTHTPTDGTTDGATTIFTQRVGATGVASKTIVAGLGRALNEFILKKNTKYVVAITTYASVYATLMLDWYEEA